ncbi:MAG: hypothetical protein JWM02_2241 [Frankiales bacterium]|nr:hypothetical protein [Frankiales bacterium]
MPGSLLDLLAVGLVVVVLRARPQVVLGVLAAAILLVPGPLVVPHTGTSFLTLQHVLVLAGLGRLVLDLLDGSVSRSDLRLTRVHAALLLLLAVAFLGGIAFAAGSGPLGAAGFRLADLADALGFFTVCLVLTRRVGASTALSAAGLGLLLGAAVAAAEHLTSVSYGHVLFSRLPAQQSQSAAFPLSLRGGQLRVRAGAEFALQFAWIVVAMTPALLVTALRRRGGLWFASVGAALAVLVVYWSYSRSALLAAAVAVCLTAALARQRLLAALGALGGLLALGGYLLVPSIAGHLNSSVDTGSIAIRSLRLAPVMELASHHPFRGAGLGQLITSGFPTTDEAFLLEYVELGVLGVLALTIALLVALTETARSLLVSEREDRLVAAACFVGVLAFVVSCFTYDAATLVQGAHSLWLLVAVATVLGEQRLGRRVVQPRGPLVRRAVAGGLVGLVAGLVTFALAPEHTAQRAVFTTLPLPREAISGYDNVFFAQRLINTVCGAVTTAALPHVSVDCTDTFGAAGVGQWRVQAGTPAALANAVNQLTELARDRAGILYLHVAPLEHPRTGRDSWAVTAPVWACLGLAFLVTLLWPTRRLAPVPEQPPTGRDLAPRPSALEQRAVLVAEGP